MSTGFCEKNVRKIKCKLKNTVLWEIKNNRKIRKIKRKINTMSQNLKYKYNQKNEI